MENLDLTTPAWVFDHLVFVGQSYLGAFFPGAYEAVNGRETTTDLWL
jgi:hypothetical protein